VGSTGALTGFAGGLEVKAHLLVLEGARNGRRGSELAEGEVEAAVET
jgi:hypothetical protein